MSSTETAPEIATLLDAIAVLWRAVAIALLEQGVMVISGAVGEMGHRLRTWEEEQFTGRTARPQEP